MILHLRWCTKESVCALAHLGTAPWCNPPHRHNMKVKMTCSTQAMSFLFPNNHTVSTFANCTSALQLGGTGHGALGATLFLNCGRPSICAVPSHAMIPHLMPVIVALSSPRTHWDAAFAHPPPFVKPWVSALSQEKVFVT